MESRPDYDRKIPLAQLAEFALVNNFIQIVKFTTWSRVINGSLTKGHELTLYETLNDCGSSL